MASRSPLVIALKFGQHGNNRILQKQFPFQGTAFCFGGEIIEYIEAINNFLWEKTILYMIIFVGLGLSTLTGFFQIRNLPEAIRCLYRGIRGHTENRSGVSGYQALCTALAATVGTGNLAGVAGAIAIGGPGAVFWMWVSGILGMMVKLAEVVLAHHFRQKVDNGFWVGGPMYMITNGLPNRCRFLAVIFCFFGIVAVFGIGNTSQVNTIIGVIDSSFAANNQTTNLYMHALTGTILVMIIYHSFRQGAGGIGKLTVKLVPLAAGAYIILSLIAIVMRLEHLPNAFLSIIRGAFSPSAVTGGTIGSVMITIRIGVARGVFTNEAGMGTASIAHSESMEKDPITQGYFGIVEVFFDTILICTLTALVILTSSVPIQFGNDTGISLTVNAFVSVFGNWCSVVISAITILLAFATILGWGLYGIRCAQFIFGEAVWKVFPILQAVAATVGVFLNTSTAWIFAELVNGFMVIPNLIAVLYLTPVFLRIIKAHRI